MAGSINKCIIVGNLGNDPEIRLFQNGGRVATLSIATSESWKDKTTGERKEKSEWHKVVIFNEGLINLAEKYLHKGSKVYIEGKLETRSYETSSGERRYTTEIVLRPYSGDLQILSKIESNNTQEEGSFVSQEDEVEEDWDDEIPFN